MTDATDDRGLQPALAEADIRFFEALADVPNMRSAAFDELEIKDGGNVFLFDGYAAVFGEIADCGDFTEEVERGAFDRVLASGDNIPMLHEHRSQELLATTKSGRLKLEADGRGLRARAKLVKTDLSSRIKALVDSGDITGMSYGFIAGRGNAKIELRSGKPHRTLSNFKRLLDVSTTWEPAYVTTAAQFRSQSMLYTNDPDSWQRLLMGAYPQLAELGHDEGDRQNDELETRSAEPATEHEDTDAHLGAAETPRLAAAKRRLHIIDIEGGVPDA